jgi:5'-phosphate synthase pdxT subunit
VFLRAARLAKVVLHIGLAMVQGARHEHGEALEVAGTQLGKAVSVHPLRTAADVEVDLDALVLPGGESTTMRLATASGGLLEAIFAWMQAHPDRPVLGTCAGAILMAMPGEGRTAFLEIDVERNGWGRQRRSFEADLVVSLDCPSPSVTVQAVRSTIEGHTALPVGGEEATGETMHGVFIRAPRFTDEPRRGEVIARLDGEPVGVLDGARLALTCHPELTQDRRFHRWLLEQAASAKGGR